MKEVIKVVVAVQESVRKVVQKDIRNGLTIGFRRTATVVTSVATMCVTLVGAKPLQAATFAERAPAPAAVNLTPTGVRTNGTFLVTLSNPVFEDGKLNVLALRADVKVNTGKAGNAGKKVAQVVFNVSRNGTAQYTQREQSAPYCIFGDQENQCAARQVGDDFPNGGAVIRIGTYSVDIAVYSNAANTAAPDWQGRVKFVLEPGEIGAEKSALGLGQGNGPVATVIEPYYARAGFSAIQIEVRTQNRPGRPNGTGIQRVTFRVSRLDDNFTPVYVGYELNKPYCIFGEEANGTTCRTLRVGDEWPQSTRLVFDDNGEATGKEADPDIAVSTIEPGEYNFSIFIEADNGTWSSNADMTLVAP